MEDRIKDKLRKVLELSVRGVDGEMQAAKVQLEKLLDKYKLSLSDISDEALVTANFIVSSDYEFSLLVNLTRTIVDREVKFMYYGKNRKRLHCSIKAWEKAELEHEYVRLRAQYRKDQRANAKRFHIAWLNKNELVCDREWDKERGASSLSLTDIMLIQDLMSGIGKHRTNNKRLNQ